MHRKGKTVEKSSIAYFPSLAEKNNEKGRRKIKKHQSGSIKKKQFQNEKYKKSSSYFLHLFHFPFQLFTQNGKSTFCDE